MNSPLHAVPSYPGSAVTSGIAKSEMALSIYTCLCIMCFMAPLLIESSADLNRVELPSINAIHCACHCMHPILSAPGNDFIAVISLYILFTNTLLKFFHNTSMAYNFDFLIIYLFTYSVRDRTQGTLGK